MNRVELGYLYISTYFLLIAIALGIVFIAKYIYIEKEAKQNRYYIFIFS